MWEYVIPAAANIVGGLLSSDATSSANAANISNQNSINATNIAMQKEFAQNGIRWKVEDAKAAGLHPLAALGAQTMSFSPIQVGATVQADTGIGGGISGMGQDIGRAIRAGQTERERQSAVVAAAERQSMFDEFARQNHSLGVERAYLENQILHTQLKRLQVQDNPSLPELTGSPGGQFGGVKFKKAEIVSANPMQQSATAGPPAPGVTKYRFGGPHTGFNVELPAGNSPSEALESMGSLYSLYTMGRHNISRWIDDNIYSPSQGFRWLRPELLKMIERR